MTQDINAKAVVKAPVSANAVLMQRAAITLGALIAYHFASFVPLPGLDAGAAAEFFRGDGATMPFQNFSGFMLGTTPMLSALIFAEACMLVFPSLRQRHENPATRNGFERGVLALALAITALQAWGMASGLEGIQGLVVEPGTAFRISSVASMMAATALIAMLATYITRHGLGSGFWLLVLTPILSSALSKGGVLLAAVNTGTVPLSGLLVPLVFIAAATLALVTLERSSPGIAASQSLIWPVLLAGAAPLWLMTPVLPFVPPEAMEGITKLVTFGQPLRLIALAVLVPALTFLRFQSMAETGLKIASVNNPVSIALVLTAIMIAGDVLIAWSGLALMPDGETVVILVSVALSVLAAVRTVALK